RTSPSAPSARAALAPPAPGAAAPDAHAPPRDVPRACSAPAARRLRPPLPARSRRARASARPAPRRAANGPVRAPRCAPRRPARRSPRRRARRAPHAAAPGRRRRRSRLLLGHALARLLADGLAGLRVGDPATALGDLDAICARTRGLLARLAGHQRELVLEPREPVLKIGVLAG